MSLAPFFFLLYFRLIPLSMFSRDCAEFIKALGSFDYDEGDLREALAGVSRDTGGGDEAHSMIAYGANATCKAIALLFYIVASSGALCLACGVLAVFGRSRAKKSQ